MNINNKSHISFTSRNKTIRLADDIARIPNRWIPRVSSSKYEGLKSSQKNEKLIFAMEADISDFRLLQKLKSIFIGNNFIKNIKNIVEPIKRFKIGNCGESADLAAIAARVNGIKNISIASIRTPTGIPFDHAVLLVNDKKPYIIDGWLGFADYVPNAILRYKKEFRNHFDFEKLEKEEMFVVPYKSVKIFNGFLNKEFTKKEINEIKKLYPEIVLKWQNRYKIKNN